MFGLDAWDIVLLAIAGFIAVTTLVRLMLARRDELMKRLRSEFDDEQARLKREVKKHMEKEEAKKAA